MICLRVQQQKPVHRSTIIRGYFSISSRFQSWQAVK